MLELILSVIAWKRGWKGWSLLPLVIAGLFGFLVGITGADEEAMPIVLFVDAISIAILIVMIARPRKVKNTYIKPIEPVTTDENPVKTKIQEVTKITEGEHSFLN